MGRLGGLIILSARKQHISLVETSVLQRLARGSCQFSNFHILVGLTSWNPNEHAKENWVADGIVVQGLCFDRRCQAFFDDSPPSFFALSRFICFDPAIRLNIPEPPSRRRS
jgi:hypothetical protein